MAKKTQPTFNFHQDETKVHPALIKYCGYCLFKSSNWLRALMNEELKDFNIITGHLGVLKIIEASELISQINLGEQLGIDKATMVKLIDELEGQKMVERVPHPTDRRVKNIRITKHGQKIMDKCQEAKGRAEKKFFEPLTATEEKAFREIVKKLIPPTPPTGSGKK